jgi:hypothetical protein
MEQSKSELKTSCFSLGDMPAMGPMIASGHHFIFALEIVNIGSIYTLGLSQNIPGAVVGSNFPMLNRS